MGFQDFEQLRRARQTYWFGFYDRNTDPEFGYPYPIPEQLRTHYTFWHRNKRFLLDFESRPALDSDSFVLSDKESVHWIVYREDVRSIQFDLSEAPGPLPAVAVDTKREYWEVDLGLLKPRLQRIDLPRESDWAIAIGEFD